MREPFNAATWLVDRHVSAGNGDRLAVICEGRRYTYRELADEIARTAAALRSLGVRPEERIAMAMGDSVPYVAMFLGALRIGAVPVPMNPLLPGRDLAVITADARAAVAVVSEAAAGCIDDLCSGAPEVATVIVAGETPPDVGSGHARILNWDEFRSGAEGGDDAPYPTWDESPGFWLCTSGSTGQPKLAAHRHADIRVTCETYARSILEITPEDRCYSVGPMFHAYGLGNSLTFPFSVGASSILEPARPPTPARVAELVTTHQPTLFFCIPTFYAALNSSELDSDTFATVRLAASAAEPLPTETFERFRDRFGITVLDGIGSTEMLHIYMSNSLRDLRAGTSGKPVEGYEVRIVDDDGRDQPPGEPGQLLVKGQSMTTGYWCQSEINRATFDGPWMRTGDLYDVDDDGFHTYLGRVDDMLRVGGEWISPAEVEATLISHPSVLEAAVVGEHDADGVLRPVAYVIPFDGGAVGIDDLAGELTGFCRERLAGYKRPRRYEIVDDLPKTATGKIQRFKLRS
ncbi:benzoate-CoA ligase family protein [Candidatus Poriferisodalis sp.]|uniref:benzoate-CoA ligase family protein n=1 Tax=Candidatus Poriferisodalis sp. TaxID=3101277 RepID=UPI003B010E23